MQPLRFAGNPETGLVHVFDRSLGNMIAHGLGEGPQPFGAILADARNCCRGQRDAEQIGDQPGDPLFGQ